MSKGACISLPKVAGLRIIAFVALLVVALGIPSGSSLAEVENYKADLVDNYLESQFDWAMLIDQHNMNDHFTYEGSRLNPLTKVRVKVRSFNKSKNGINDSPAQVYEELWYHQRKPLGLHRLTQLSMPPVDSNGAVIIRKADKQSSPGERAFPLANTLVRLLIELQVKQIVVSVVLIPAEDYAGIAGALETYHFFPSEGTDAQGPQMSIHLRSYPPGQDEYYFYRN
jgi:hypothetical protein